MLALYIAKDVEFYDPEMNEKAQVNSTNIADELGQIEFLFSDKTGTLTQNKMIFKRYYLAGDHHIYDMEESGLFMQVDTRKSKLTSKSVEFLVSDEDEYSDDLSDMSTEQRNNPLRKRVLKLSRKAKRFWTNIVLCHSIEAEINKDPSSGSETIAYKVRRL